MSPTAQVQSQVYAKPIPQSCQASSVAPTSAPHKSDKGPNWPDTFDLPVMTSPAGTFYEYAPKLFAFEFSQLHSKNVLVFVGGLGDGFNTVPYLATLSERLNEIGWSLIQIQMNDSYRSWGTGSLAQDAEDISNLIKFLKPTHDKIGLMGHSTGCQDTVQYVTRLRRDEDYVPLDFGIIQAPASDRLCINMLMPENMVKESIAIAKKLIAEDGSLEIIPRKYWKHFFETPINAYRWNSLAAPGGDDDFFSEDLPDSEFATTFGKFDTPLLVLYSGIDEFVPKSVNKFGLMDRFAAACKPGIWSTHSAVIKGGVHNLGAGSEPGALEDALDRVIKFISDL